MSQTTTIGVRLKQAREAIPASLYQASRETKIRVDFLESMEQGNFNFVSGGPYVKGMLRSYGRWLRLDDGQLSEEFTNISECAEEPSVTQIVREPARVPPRKRPRWVLAAVLASCTLLGLSLIGVMNPVGNVASPPDAPKESLEPKAAAGAGLSQPASQQPVVPAAADSVKVTVTVVGAQSWVEAYADSAAPGQPPLFKGIMGPGMAKTFEAKDLVRTRIGDMGAVRININGRDLGVPGASGQVGNFVFNPASTTFVAP